MERTVLFFKRSPKIHSFSDFAPKTGALPGEKTRIESVLGQEIILLSFRIGPSKKQEGREYVQIQFSLNGRVYILFTSSIVLIKQCREFEHCLPFRTRIIKINNYYTFS
jgi:hypothetical protein